MGLFFLNVILEFVLICYRVFVVVSLSFFNMILGLVSNLLLCVCYCEFVCKFVFLGGCQGNLSMLQLFCLLGFYGKIFSWNGGLLSGDKLQLCDNFIKNGGNG